MTKMTTKTHKLSLSCELVFAVPQSCLPERGFFDPKRCSSYEVTIHPLKSLTSRSLAEAAGVNEDIITKLPQGYIYRSRITGGRITGPWEGELVMENDLSAQPFTTKLRVPLKEATTTAILAIEPTGCVVLSRTSLTTWLSGTNTPLQVNIDTLLRAGKSSSAARGTPNAPAINPVIPFSIVSFEGLDECSVKAVRQGRCEAVALYSAGTELTLPEHGTLRSCFSPARLAKRGWLSAEADAALVKLLSQGRPHRDTRALRCTADKT
jgi:hypothetical protein